MVVSPAAFDQLQLGAAEGEEGLRVVHDRVNYWAGVGAQLSPTVQRLVDTGISINDDPVVEFVLAVQPGPGPGHEARARALVSRLDLPAVQPGRVFAIHYDPQQPERAAIDGWECD